MEMTDYEAVQSDIKLDKLEEFTKYINDIYPKFEIVVKRENTTFYNNIISYCSIL